MAWRGIGIGAAVFLLLAAVACFTPARVPALQHLGRDYAALQLRLRATRLEAALLQPQGSATFTSRDQVPALERARAAVTEAEERLVAWQRANSRLSAFGFLGWVLDLWPWLLGLGFALPALGGLVGAQAGRSRASDPVGVHPAAARAPDPAASGAETRATHGSGPTASVLATRATSAAGGSPLQASVDTVAETDAPVVSVIPPDPAAWNWAARPAPRTAPSRPKPPPVQSPHGSDAGE